MADTLTIFFFFSYLLYQRSNGFLFNSRKMNRLHRIVEQYDDLLPTGNICDHILHAGVHTAFSQSLV